MDLPVAFISHYITYAEYAPFECDLFYIMGYFGTICRVPDNSQQINGDCLAFDGIQWESYRICNVAYGLGRGMGLSILCQTALISFNFQCV